MKSKTLSLARNNFRPHPDCVRLFQRMPAIRTQLQLEPISDELLWKMQRLNPLLVTKVEDRCDYLYCSSPYLKNELENRGKSKITVQILDDGDPVAWCIARLICDMSIHCMPAIWREALREMLMQLGGDTELDQYFSAKVTSYRRWSEFTGTPKTALQQYKKQLEAIRAQMEIERGVGI